MGKPREKPLIGVVGGIASGKSTVAAAFAKLGCAVIDADDIAHGLLEDSGVREQIISLFGRDILDGDGWIDCALLAERAFRDAGELARLNGVLHPLVLARTNELIEEYEQCDDVWGIVLDMPLLVEVGWARRCDRLVFVECREELRIERARQSGFLDAEQIKIREKFQNSLDSKMRLADNVIDNNSGFSALVKQVTTIFSSIEKG